VKELAMPKLTALEAAALNEICEREASQQGILKAQIAVAIASRRRNSGFGFFTNLSTDHSLAPIGNGRRVIGSIVANVEGFEGPLFLLLFMKDGCVSMLEGATVQDSTVGVDFSKVVFNIDPASPTRLSQS
jgi:hypothetical protein